MGRQPHSIRPIRTPGPATPDNQESATMRVAVVTPYYKEPEAWLARCLTSVREQTYPVTHLVVADGHPQPWGD